MTSHHYQLDSRRLAALLLAPLAACAGLALALHAGAASGLFPSPRPAGDLDQAILSHQIEAARSPQPEVILLAGDSSCLMDVDARELSRLLEKPVRNLGTSSYLDLASHAALLQTAIQSKGDSTRTVVLLMHPEALRRPEAQRYQTDVFHSLLAGRDLPAAPSPQGRLRSLLGLAILEGRILNRWLSRPLGGAYGRAYGFIGNLEARMTEHRGSLLEPNREPARGNPEYFLHPRLESLAAVFRRTLPAKISLVVGITPLPHTFAPPGYADQHREMLEEWARWLGAGRSLSELPATLPDELFATKTHLNAEGVAHYTGLLAGALSDRP